MNLKINDEEYLDVVERIERDGLEAMAIEGCLDDVNEPEVALFLLAREILMKRINKDTRYKWALDQL